MKVGDLVESLTTPWDYQGVGRLSPVRVARPPQHFSIISKLYPDNEIVEVTRIKTGLTMRYTYGVFSTLFKILQREKVPNFECYIVYNTLTSEILSDFSENSNAWIKYSGSGSYLKQINKRAKFDTKEEADEMAKKLSLAGKFFKIYKVESELVKKIWLSSP